MSAKIQPRGWQEQALEEFMLHSQPNFLLEATPGSGKTIFSGLCVESLIADQTIDTVIIVTPTSEIKNSFVDAFSQLGISITPALRTKGANFPSAYTGAVITYQKLANMAEIIKVWHGHRKIMFIFDEVHHVSKDMSWGAAVAEVAPDAVRCLSMTGTPFRSDGSKIWGVDYDNKGNAAADTKPYTYKAAVADGVCRPIVSFINDGEAKWKESPEDPDITKVWASESTPENRSKVSSQLFADDSDWMSAEFTRADEYLQNQIGQDYRVDSQLAEDFPGYNHRPKPAGLIVCRPGFGEDEDRHVLKVANMVHAKTGQKPVVVRSGDPDSIVKIKLFREDPMRDQPRWIVAVRMISEGVDIPRLRATLFACAPGTELLTRQIAGRVARHYSQPKHILQQLVSANRVVDEDAAIFCADFPDLREWLRRLSEEAESGLIIKEGRKPREPNEPGEPSSFLGFGSSHQEGDAIAYNGETYEPELVELAKSIHATSKISASSTPLFAVLEILKLGGVDPSTVSRPASDPSPKKTEHELREEKRREIKNTAIKRLNAVGMEYGDFWRLLWSRVRAHNMDDLCENYPIEEMDKVLEVIGTLGREAI